MSEGTKWSDVKCIAEQASAAPRPTPPTLPRTAPLNFSLIHAPDCEHGVALQLQRPAGSPLLHLPPSPQTLPPPSLASNTSTSLPRLKPPAISLLWQVEFVHRDERALGVTCSQGTSNSALACSHCPCNALPHPSADLDVLFHSVSRIHTRQALVLLAAPICDLAHSLSSLHSAHADAAPRLLPPHSPPDHQGWPPTPPPQRVCLRRPRLHPATATP